MNLTICAIRDCSIVGPEPIEQDKLTAPKYGFSDEIINLYRSNTSSKKFINGIDFFGSPYLLGHKEENKYDNAEQVCVALMQLARSGIIIYSGLSESKELHKWIVDKNLKKIFTIINPKLEKGEEELEIKIKNFLSKNCKIKNIFYGIIKNNYQ